MTSGGQQERYTMGYGSAHDYFNMRTSSVEARFFIPHLRSDMKLLDCGSGPGSIDRALAIPKTHRRRMGVIVPEPVEVSGVR